MANLRKFIDKQSPVNLLLEFKGKGGRDFPKLADLLEKGYALIEDICRQTGVIERKPNGIYVSLAPGAIKGEPLKVDRARFDLFRRIDEYDAKFKGNSSALYDTHITFRITCRRT